MWCVLNFMHLFHPYFSQRGGKAGTATGVSAVQAPLVPQSIAIYSAQLHSFIATYIYIQFHLREE